MSMYYIIILNLFTSEMWQCQLTLVAVLPILRMRTLDRERLLKTQLKKKQLFFTKIHRCNDLKILEKRPPFARNRIVLLNSKKIT